MSGGLYIGGGWTAGRGGEFVRDDPALGVRRWSGRAADGGQVEAAVAAARKAAAGWAMLGVERRSEYLTAFAEQLRGARGKLAEAISQETGKPRWESQTEVDAMIAKIALSQQALGERRTATTKEASGVTAATRYKPHGVLAAIGPFNFPGHVPNGHIVPALLAGNTVVFKPSELTPGVAELTVKCWQAAGLPAGVLNLLQGGAEVGRALGNHADIDGLLFTGSRIAGTALSAAFAGNPERILALEMGGNNPLVVTDAANVDTAVYAIVQSAFITYGQRCTCARRLIVIEKQADRLIERLAEVTRRIAVGPYTRDPEPFMGPLITPGAAERLSAAWEDLLARGGRAIVPLVRMLPHGPAAPNALVRPALVDVTAMTERRDEELFGPLLQIIRVRNFDAAIAEANRTRYGLVAGLLSDARALYERFFAEVRAGLINWNRPTTGASSGLPFGGIGWSGNHRPSGYFAADYCSYPIAALESPVLAAPAKLVPGIEL